MTAILTSGKIDSLPKDDSGGVIPKRKSPTAKRTQSQVEAKGNRALDLDGDREPLS